MARISSSLTSAILSTKCRITGNVNSPGFAARRPTDTADFARCRVIRITEYGRGRFGHAHGFDDADPEALAAYADRGLDPQEAARLEEHVAECDRCTSILAVLTNISAEPLAAREAPSVREAGAGWAHTSRASKHRAGIGSQLLARWRWIAPAVGVAAAAAVWFVLRPMPHEVLPPPQLSAQNTTRESRRPQPLDSVSPKVSKLHLALKHINRGLHALLTALLPLSLNYITKLIN